MLNASECSWLHLELTQETVRLHKSYHEAWKNMSYLYRDAMKAAVQTSDAPKDRTVDYTVSHLHSICTSWFVSESVFGRVWLDQGWMLAEGPMP